MRELTSFHHTEAEFKHSSSKITSKPNFVRTINCDLTRISFMFPATHNHILIIECCTHLRLVCVCVCSSFRLLELQRRRLPKENLHAPLRSVPLLLLLLIYKSCAPAAAQTAVLNTTAIRKDALPMNTVLRDVHPHEEKSVSSSSLLLLSTPSLSSISQIQCLVNPNPHR